MYVCMYVLKHMRLCTYFALKSPRTDNCVQVPTYIMSRKFYLPSNYKFLKDFDKKASATLLQIFFEFL